jgi:myo-inositol-1(or 4)-monophosphatase
MRREERSGSGSEAILARIRNALVHADEILQEFTPGDIEARRKEGGDPVTAADLALDKVLREDLLAPGDGWLSEETADNADRLDRSRIWVVDPIDGTKEFVTGIPEWCVSIGYVEEGEAVAGGIFNRATGESIIGSIEAGVRLNGEPVRARATGELDGALVLASRSEVNRGEWERFGGGPFTLRPMGSVAYKLGLVAAGLADATWTLVPKNEWDIAAGVALIRAAGGESRTLQWERPRFNRKSTLLNGLVACGPNLLPKIGAMLGLPSSAEQPS